MSFQAEGEESFCAKFANEQEQDPSLRSCKRDLWTNNSRLKMAVTRNATIAFQVTAIIHPQTRLCN